MTKEQCMHVLEVMEGAAPPSRELIQQCRALGAKAVHHEFETSMLLAGWADGGRKTDYASLMTPHVRKWKLLSGPQRRSLIACETMEVVAQWPTEAEPLTFEHGVTTDGDAILAADVEGENETH